MSKFQDPALRWAHRHDPFTAVKVWWHGTGTQPIISISGDDDESYDTSWHLPDGREVGGDEYYDLVPLQEPLLECWANICEGDNSGQIYGSEKQAKRKSRPYHDRIAVKMREVRDE